MFDLRFLRFVGYRPMLSGMSEIPTYHFFLKFTFRKDVFYVFGNGRSSLPKERRHLFLCYPDRLVFQEHLYPDGAVGAFVENDFAGRVGIVQHTTPLVPLRRRQSRGGAYA
jgi:hypothetical protein